MGYRVDYQPVNKRCRSWWIRPRVVVMTAIAFALFLLSVSAFWQEGRRVLSGILLLEDVDATLDALESFVQQIGDGVKFADAVKAFCRESLYEGGFS